MNFEIDLKDTEKQLLEKLDIKIEDRKYSTNEIRRCIDTIIEHIMSKSSKNGDLTREFNIYSELANDLQKYIS